MSEENEYHGKPIKAYEPEGDTAASESALDDLLYLDYNYENIPYGFELCGDDEIVCSGFIVIDNNEAPAAARIYAGGKYNVLIGMTGNDARCHSLCYDIFKKI